MHKKIVALYQSKEPDLIGSFWWMDRNLERCMRTYISNEIRYSLSVWLSDIDGNRGNLNETNTSRNQPPAIDVMSPTF